MPQLALHDAAVLGGGAPRSVRLSRRARLLKACDSTSHRTCEEQISVRLNENHRWLSPTIARPNAETQLEAMQCFKMDDPQLQLKLQVASVLCAALQQSDGPIAYLQDSHNLKFHNLGEYQYIENGPCPFLMCISDPGSVLSAQCTARKVSLAPVVYVAVEHVPGRKGTCSIAHFFCGASGEAFNDTAPGVCAAATSALTCLSELACTCFDATCDMTVRAHALSCRCASAAPGVSCA